MLLTLGTKKDEHVTRVTDALGRLGFCNVVIDYLEPTLVTLSVDEHGAHGLFVGDRRVTEPVLIWDRLKIFVAPFAIRRDDGRAASYESQEWHAFCRLSIALFGDSVVNSPQSRMCMVKPFQQTVAAASGFLVPRTTVTNCKQDALSHAQRDSSLVLKSLSGGLVMPKSSESEYPSSVMTMRVDHAAIQSASTEEVRRCPHFFQNEIPKAYEVRAVVVAGDVFAFRIDSQRLRSSRTDWRYGIDDLDFRPIRLPEAVEDRLRRFMLTLGLFSGSFDLIVDPDGQYWFLECNQDGQWSWLDDILDGALTDAFAHAFARTLEKQSDPDAASSGGA